MADNESNTAESSKITALPNAAKEPQQGPDVDASALAVNTGEGSDSKTRTSFEEVTIAVLSPVDQVDSSADERGRTGDNETNSIKSFGSTKSSGSYSSRGLTPDGVRQRWKEHVERREDDDHSCDSDCSADSEVLDWRRRPQIVRSAPGVKLRPNGSNGPRR